MRRWRSERARHDRSIVTLTAEDIDALYRSHARALVTYFSRRTLDAESAVDLVAETFAVAIASRARCRAACDDERGAWLFGIARNQLHGWYRRGAIERRALARVGLERPALVDADVERIDELAGLHELRGRIAALLAPARLANRIRRPLPGAEPQLAAQAPDPDGGLPFGMDATRASGGGYCVGQGGRVVGDRTGHVDYALDVMRYYGGATGSCPPTRAAMRGARRPGGRTPPPPYSLMTSSGGAIGMEPGEDPRAGRIARRSPGGRVVFSGTTDPDVRTLTFATPSDVRTIAPSGPAHAFLVVYAGGFPTGETVITTTYGDGRTRRDAVPNLGF